VRAAGAIAGNVLLRLRCFPANHDDAHYFLIDDLRLSPLDAPFSGTVYEPKYDLPLAALGTNGETMRTVYDSRQRPLATVGPNENATALSVPYYSRQGNNEAFNTSDPNTALSLTARNGGLFDDFNDGDAEGWNIADGAWQIVSGKLKNIGEDAADYAILGSLTSSGYYAVSAKVEKISGNDFGLQIGSVLVRWFNKWQIKDGSTLLAEDTATPLTDHWLLITSDKAVLFFADGKLVFKQILSATIFGNLKLYTGGVGTQVTFDDILVFRDPVFARSFLDGAGKTRQAQTLLGVKCQISETVYDNIGRPAVQTKTAEFGDSLFVFQPGFVTGLNWTTGAMTGRVADYYSFSGSGYSNDNGYPYARQTYEYSPLGRMLDSGLPGQPFAIGQGHTAHMQYSKNSDGTFVGTTLASGTLPVGQYFLQTGISPDGVYAYTLTDKAGNLIAEKSGPMEGGIYPTTSYEYDDYGRLVRTRLPNYYNPPSAGDWTIHYTYDFFGRLKQKTTPDAQATSFYIYDKTGRLRFMMDASGSPQTPDHIQYWKYDTLGRTLECGYIVQDWNATTLQNYADTNPTWPSAPATWRKKYTYDYNGTTPYFKGRLFKLETNNDSDTATEVEETFAYDIYGNVTTKTAKVLDYNASVYGITYEYDHAGNVTRVTYIPGHLILQNETVTGIISYSAADSITAGPAYTIASGASAVLQAGQKIRLVPGFAAQSGSYFNATIDPALTQDATVVTYKYDPLGRLINVGTPGDADFYASYTYHADSRLNSEKLANSLEVRNHFYNSPGWLLRINGSRFTEDLTHTTGWSGATGYFDGRIKTTSFTYNWAGEPADYAVQYSYDNLGQLTIADNNLNNAWDIGVGNPTSFDANGNIVDLRRGTTTKTYSYYTGTNKVQNTDGAGNDYTYDSNANVISSSPKTIGTISYDSFTQRPTSVSMSSGQSMTLEYGGATQRVLKDYSNGASVNSKLYLHGQNDYPLIEKNRVSVTAETSAVYIYGPNGAIAKRVGSTMLFLLKDHLGSTRVVMDATGLVRSYYDYDAFGNLIRIGTTNEVKYQFTGQEHDESGLHNYRARLYDSDLGKFYAVDAEGQFASPFIYVGNNPVGAIDPTGKVGVDLLIAAAFYAAFDASRAYIHDKPIGRAVASSFGQSFVSQGLNFIAQPIFESAIATRAFTSVVQGGVSSEIQSRGSFVSGFASGLVQGLAFAALQPEP